MSTRIAGAYIFYFKTMSTEPLHVKIIKALGLYIFPAIIVILLLIILLVPAPKKPAPRTTQSIDAEIQRLQQEKQKLTNQ